MGISYNWDDESKTFIIADFSPGWTWEEFYELPTHLNAMRESVDHIVHTIADFRKSGRLPGGPSITHARNVLANQPEKRGKLVIVSDSMFIRSLVSIFRRMFSGTIGEQILTAETIEEAQAIIADLMAQK